MAPLVSGIRNVEIFVLYLMENINYPLDRITINDIVFQTDYILFLDFAEGFNKLCDDKLIEIVGTDDDGNDLYAVTPRGRFIASELKSDILEEILDSSLKAALQYLDFKRRGVVVDSTIEAKADGSCILRCSFTENGKVLFNSELLVDNCNRAERMRKNFYDRSEGIYRGINALFAGNVNFLLD